MCVCVCVFVNPLARGCVNLFVCLFVCLCVCLVVCVSFGVLGYFLLLVLLDS